MDMDIILGILVLVGIFILAIVAMAIPDTSMKKGYDEQADQDARVQSGAFTTSDQSGGGDSGSNS